MTTPQYVPPGALARDIWKYEPWARAEAMRHFGVKMVWMSVAIVATLLLLPLILFAPSSLAFAIDIGAFAGGSATMFVTVIAEQVREHNQKAFIANQLAGGVDPHQVRGIPDVPGRMTFPARLFFANSIAFVLVGGIAFLAAWAVIGF
jgi:hypothetical protein